MTAADLARLDRHWNCRITVVGRRSGQPRTTTVWFVADGDTILLTGGKEDPQWCRNIRAHGEVVVEIAGTRWPGHAVVVEDPEQASVIRDRFVRKYWLARLARLFGGYTRSIPVVVKLAAAREARDPAGEDPLPSLAQARRTRCPSV